MNRPALASLSLFFVLSSSFAQQVDDSPPEAAICLRSENDKTLCYEAKLSLEPQLRNQERTLGKKVLHGISLIQGIQVANVGVLLMLPPSITNWSDHPEDDFKRHMKNAYTRPPVFDHDDWYVNYIGHPIAGAAYYNTMRSQGATRSQSFFFALAQSTFWEFVVEAGAEQPSIQDLIVTPLVGSALGELSHQATMKMAKNGFNLAEKAAVLLINPTYILNNGFKVKRKRLSPAFD